MKPIIIHLILLLSSHSLLANELPASLLKLVPILKSNEYKGNYDSFQSDNYFETFRIYKNDEWVQVRAFLKPKTAIIKQLTFFTKYCYSSKVDKKVFQKWAETDIKKIYKAFFDKEIPKELLIKSKYSSSPKAKQYKKVRVSKASYKCDVNGGDGIKIDFFFF